MSRARDQWKRVLRPRADCIAIERLGEALTPAEWEHIAACSRCHSEMELWQGFNDETTTPEEAEDVRWITEQVAQRGTAVPSILPFTRSRKFAALPRSLAVAATILLAVGVGYFLDNRQPSIDVPAGRGAVYRSEGIRVIAPIGDVATKPIQLTWTDVPGAKSYDVRIVEVDQTILWRASTREPRVDVPAAVSAQFVPGKTILWDVTARRDATALADSGTQKFRVAVR